MLSGNWIAIPLSMLLVACGADENPQPIGASGSAGASAAGGSGGSGVSGAGGSGGMGAALGWQSLITGSWSVAPGNEDYFCARRTLDQDLLIGAFEAINPGGTHHTVLTMGEPTSPDGFGPCTSFENHRTMIFGSGVGTSPFELPEGVAVRLRAGQQLLLNLHVFNTTGDTITGESGTRAKLIEAAAAEFEAESILAGTLNVSLPAQQETQTTGNCTLTAPGTIFAVQPHMHQLGTHMKVTLHTSTDARVLHDGAYDFNEQFIYPLAPLRVLAGDRVEVVCTHVNSKDALVTWGESSTAEMCHAGLYRYPSGGDPYFFCQY